MNILKFIWGLFKEILEFAWDNKIASSVLIFIWFINPSRITSDNVIGTILVLIFFLGVAEIKKFFTGGSASWLKKSDPEKWKKYRKLDEEHGSFENKEEQEGYTWTDEVSMSLANDRVKESVDNDFSKLLYLNDYKKSFAYTKYKEKMQYIKPIDLTKGLLAVGKIGSGKTELFHSILFQNKLNKLFNRTVIHDYKGDFVQRGFNPDKDIIFNTFDERTKVWDFFKEIEKHPNVVKSFVEGFLKSTSSKDGKADFFTSSAIELVNEYVFKIGFNNNIPNNEKYSVLVRELLAIGQKLADGSSTENKDSFNTAKLIIPTLEMFDYLINTLNRDTFTIDGFLNDKETTLFLLNNPSNATALKPLFDGFTLALTNIFLSRADTKEDLTLFLLDEVLQFNLIPLKGFVNTARSKGGCIVFGTQHLAIHEKELSEIITMASHVTVMFKIDNATKKDTIANFGTIKYQEENESVNSKAREVTNMGSGMRSFISPNDTNTTVSRTSKTENFLRDDIFDIIPEFHSITIIKGNTYRLYQGYCPMVEKENYESINELRDNPHFIQLALNDFYSKKYSLNDEVKEIEEVKEVESIKTSNDEDEIFYNTFLGDKKEVHYGISDNNLYDELSLVVENNNNNVYLSVEDFEKEIMIVGRKNNIENFDTFDYPAFMDNFEDTHKK